MINRISSRQRAISVMIIAMICISFSGVLLRLMDGSDPWKINFYRAIAFTTAICLLLMFRYGRNSIHRLRGIGLAGVAGGILLGIAGIAYLHALTSTTIANTVFILATIPFLSATLAYLFLREKVQAVTIYAMCAAAAGIAVMVADGIGAGTLYGNSMALVAATAFSSYAVVVRAKRDIEMLPALLFAGLLIAIVSAVIRWGDIALSHKDILLCFIWGGLLSGFANSVFVLASRHLRAAEVTLIILLEFALAPIWVWLVVNEIPGSLTLLGGMLVIGAVAGKAILELYQIGVPKPHQDG